MSGGGGGNRGSESAVLLMDLMRATGVVDEVDHTHTHGHTHTLSNCVKCFGYLEKRYINEIFYLYCRVKYVGAEVLQ